MKSTNYFVKSSLLLVFISSMFFMQGCKPRLLPSTNVSDTRENKRVVTFLEQYKAAIEKRSVDAIMELVAKDFKDNMGNPEDPSLYMDYLGLKEKLEKSFPRIQDIRLGLFVQRIAKIEKDTYETVFYFNKQILTEVPSGEKWVSIKEVSRMVIRQRHDKDRPYEFEILQGI
jgi:hypothetical protein